MEAEVFVEKIENLVNEFMKNVDEDSMEINGKDYRILYKKKEIIKPVPHLNKWTGDLVKGEYGVRREYGVQYCSCCGRPIYYTGKFIPTLCSYCETI